MEQEIKNEEFGPVGIVGSNNDTTSIEEKIDKITAILTEINNKMPNKLEEVEQPIVVEPTEEVATENVDVIETVEAPVEEVKEEKAEETTDAE